jgi:DNA (cytosine-5)-methyltransferase 1
MVKEGTVSRRHLFTTRVSRFRNRFETQNDETKGNERNRRSSREGEMDTDNRPTSLSLRNLGLFAGIGGIEQGFHLAGHVTELLCESDPAARAVLKAHFPGIPVEEDICKLTALPKADIVSAGFPCQDLSQAGKTAGIRGQQSGLVTEVFRLLADASPRWVLFENVPFMLHLQGGKAMRRLTQHLERLDFRWAYRTVDAQCFGLPQRRQRVLLLASRTEDPCSVLFADEASAPTVTEDCSPCGFYWTEGNRGLGWAVDAVPPLKGGSKFGIPSPPAIWRRDTDGSIVQPDIRDAERLQGFPPDWTLPAIQVTTSRKGVRWKLVGNAVSVLVARWLGNCLSDPGCYDGTGDAPLKRRRSWPHAGWGKAGKARIADVSMWPVAVEYQHLADFLEFPPTPLSERATAGFLARAKASPLRFSDGFLAAVETHLEKSRVASAQSHASREGAKQHKRAR